MFLIDFDAVDADDRAVLAAYADAETARKAMQAADALAAKAQDTDDENDVDPMEEGSALTSSSKPLQVREQTWVNRLRDVGDIPGERMAPIHGRLIAHGFLHFQLQGREDGVVYRLTTAGRKLLQKTPTTDDSVVSHEPVTATVDSDAA